MSSKKELLPVNKELDGAISIPQAFDQTSAALPLAITCSETIRQACPQLRLGLLTARVHITPSAQTFWQDFEPLLKAKADLSQTEIQTLPALRAARQAYKALGQDPSRYRLSAEALHRRLRKGQGLYRINNGVDIINRVSLETGFSIGGYDLDQIHPPVFLERGQKGQTYQAIGRGALNLEALPVLYDQQGPFGNPSSDSERTAIGAHTTWIALVFFDFGGHPELEHALHRTAHLLTTWAHAQALQYWIQSC